jgi:zinc finger HIT domain-containing protein 3
VPRPGTVAAAGFKGPFAVLDDSRELQALFRQFPRLPSQLNEINAATLRPIEVPGKSHFGRGKEEPWNQDRGLQNGVHALCQAREAYGKDGEGVREFGRLVLQLLSRDEAMDAAELIEKELAEENAMIIQQLLNREI